MLSQDYIALDEKYGAHNYHPLPVVISKARGCRVTDPDGNAYFDFLSAYSAVNQGHLHPAIVDAAREQLERVTLTSRAFHNDRMGPFLEKLCAYTGFESALPMNTGAEAVETALKAARRWGVEVKGVPNERQRIVCAEGNFHGRTLALVSLSSDPDARINYGPYMPGIDRVPFADAAAIEAAIGPDTVAVILEPIQGEAGVVIPPEGYLRRVRELCSANSTLFIDDEIQTGFCRTGRRFAWEFEDARPDIMCLGKALGGGIMPVSAIVADRGIMNVFTPGTHGSTFGGNPLACAIGLASIQVLEDEKLDENAARLGRVFRERIARVGCPVMLEVRGKGLLNAVEFERGYDAYSVCLALGEAGLLAKQTHGSIIRFAPPLVITAGEMDEALSIIETVFENL